MFILLILLWLFPALLISFMYGKNLTKSDRLNIFLLESLGILLLSLVYVGKLWL